jgi:hypothetical protein
VPTPGRDALAPRLRLAQEGNGHPIRPACPALAGEAGCTEIETGLTHRSRTSRLTSSGGPQTRIATHIPPRTKHQPSLCADHDHPRVVQRVRRAVREGLALLRVSPHLRPDIGRLMSCCWWSSSASRRRDGRRLWPAAPRTATSAILWRKELMFTRGSDPSRNTTSPRRRAPRRRSAVAVVGAMAAIFATAAPAMAAGPLVPSAGKAPTRVVVPSFRAPSPGSRARRASPPAPPGRACVARSGLWRASCCVRNHRRARSLLGMPRPTRMAGSIA